VTEGKMQKGRGGKRKRRLLKMSASSGVVRWSLKYVRRPLPVSQSNQPVPLLAKSGNSSVLGWL